MAQQGAQGAGAPPASKPAPRPVVRPSSTDVDGPVTRGRQAWSGVARVLALLGVVIGGGALAGMALGYPLRTLDLGGTPAVALDQQALAGTIDPALALVTDTDLPRGFTTNPQDDGSLVRIIGAPYCGSTVAPDSPVGDHLARTFLHARNGWVILAEVQRVRRAQDAGKYIREVAANFDECPGGKYFRVDGEARVELAILDDRPDPPVVDYVSRTLEPVKGGPVQIVTYFQVGTTIVAIEYVGPGNPPKSLLGDAEREILYRLAPEQFSKTTKVNGKQPLPGEAATTTVAGQGQASPTSSPPPPPTVATSAPPPTFEPTTTVKKSSTKSSTKSTAKTTAPPPTSAPAG